MNNMFDLKKLANKVAVITGSASGLGFELAIECQNIGMHVVLTDIRKNVLNNAVKQMKMLNIKKCNNNKVVGFVCDVTSSVSLNNLLGSIRKVFPNTPLGFVGANAGVLFTGSTLLTGTSLEWQKTFDVNVQGVYLTLKTFVPVLLAQQTESVVEITASAAGVLFGGGGPYNLSKLSALGIAEGLHAELLTAGGLGKIRVVALCPAIVNTDLLQSGEEAMNGTIKAQLQRAHDNMSSNTVQMFQARWTKSMSPDWVAKQVLKHVEEEKFYCILSNIEGVNSTYSDNLDARILQRYSAMKSRQISPFLNRSMDKIPKLATMPFDLNKLKDGVAIITGSATGMGFAMGKKAKALGMHVILSDVRKEALSTAVQKLRLGVGNGRVEGVVADVTSEESLKKLLKSATNAFPGKTIQFLGANAGVLYTGSTILSGSESEWQTTYNVNVIGAANTLRAIVPHMAKTTSHDKPCIIEITASSAGVIFGGAGPYGTSKLAALGLAEELYKELDAHPSKPLASSRVVVLCPAIVVTDLLQSGEQATGGKIQAEMGRTNDASSVNAVRAFQAMWNNGMDADYVANEVFNHAQTGKFYCILDNTVERDGFSMNLEATMDRRLNAMLSRDIKYRYGSPFKQTAVLVEKEDALSRRKVRVESKL